MLFLRMEPKSQLGTQRELGSSSSPQKSCGLHHFICSKASMRPSAAPSPCWC